MSAVARCVNPYICTSRKALVDVRRQISITRIDARSAVLRAMGVSLGSDYRERGTWDVLLNAGTDEWEKKIGRTSAEKRWDWCATRTDVPASSQAITSPYSAGFRSLIPYARQRVSIEHNGDEVGVHEVELCWERTYVRALQGLRINSVESYCGRACTYRGGGARDRPRGVVARLVRIPLWEACTPRRRWRHRPRVLLLLAVVLPWRRQAPVVPRAAGVRESLWVQGIGSVSRDDRIGIRRRARRREGRLEGRVRRGVRR
jgi:hypothetical protein